MFVSLVGELEVTVFEKGAQASRAHWDWKRNGSGRIPVCRAVRTTKVFQPNVVSPDLKGDEEEI